LFFIATWYNEHFIGTKLPKTPLNSDTLFEVFKTKTPPIGGVKC